MNSKELLEESNKIFDCLKDNCTLRKGKVNYSGLPYGMTKNWLTKFPNEFWRDVYKSPGFLLMDEKHQEMASEKVKDLINEYRSKEESQDRYERLKRYDDADIPESYLDRDNFLPILDIQSKDAALVLLDKTTKRLSNMTYKAWESLLDPETRKNKHEIIRDGILEYNPYDLRPWYEDKFGGHRILKVNMYQPPKWRIESQDWDAETFYPKVIKELIDHLFADDYEKELLFDWLREMILGRNEYALVLHSEKGIGKQVFTDLLTGLSGLNNTGLAQESFFTTDFNSVLKNNRLIVIDEKNIDEKAHLKLKRYLNEIQNIEAKGVDADSLMKTHNNFLITQNKTERLHLEPDDRRFLILKTNSEDLTKLWDVEFIEEFKKSVIEGDENVAQFGRWLIEHGAMYDKPKETYKSDLFWDKVRDALSPWQGVILSTVLEEGNSIYKLKDFKKIYKSKNNGDTKHFPLYAKVETFLETYKHKNEDKLGVIETDEDGDKVLKVSEKFIKNYVDYSEGVDGLDILDDNSEEEEDQDDLL